MTLGFVHTLKSKCENCTYLIRCQGQHKSAVEKVILIFESVASFFFDGNLSDVYSKESALICTVNILGIGMVPYSHFHWASITDRPYREVGRILSRDRTTSCIVRTRTYPTFWLFFVRTYLPTPTYLFRLLNINFTEKLPKIIFLNVYYCPYPQI